MIEAKLAQRAELSRKTCSGPTALTKEIDRLTAEYDSIRAQIKLKSPRYAALTEPQPFTLIRFNNASWMLIRSCSNTCLARSEVTFGQLRELKSRVMNCRRAREIEAAARKFRDLLT